MATAQKKTAVKKIAPKVKQKPGPKPKPLPPAAPKKRRMPRSELVVTAKNADQEKRFAALRKTAVDASNARTQAIKSPDRHLTEKMQTFVRNWAAGESILSASSRAGYADGGAYAYRLAKDPLILAIYEREKKLYEQSCQMTRKKVMDGFIAAAEMAQLQADPTAMVGAYREIGKMCGYYEPKKVDVNVNVNGTITQKVERLTDDMLLKIIRGEAGAEVFDQDMAEVPDTPFKELAA